MYVLPLSWTRSLNAHQNIKAPLCRQTHDSHYSARAPIPMPSTQIKKENPTLSYQTAALYACHP